MMRYTYAILLSVVSLFPLTSPAEEHIKLERSPNLTLSKVVEQAILHHPKQNEVLVGNALVEAKMQQARHMLPKAPAITIGHQNDIIGSNRNLNQSEVGIEIPIWMSGQKSARESATQALKTELDSTRGNLSLDIAGQVRDNLWSISMLTVDAELAESQLKNMQAIQNDVEKRWKAGELAKTDFLVAQNGTLLAKTVLIKALAEVKHAEHQYWILTGLKELPLSFEEPISSINTIEENHPLLTEATAKVQMANKQSELIAIESRENPQVIINMRRERGAFDTLYDDSMGISVRIPVDTKAHSSPMLASAELAIAQAASSKQQQQRLLEKNLHEATHNLETVREEITILEEQNKLSQINLQLAKKAFSLGETDLINLLRNQATAYEAERAMTRAYTQLQWNIARYNQAIGVLP